MTNLDWDLLNKDCFTAVKVIDLSISASTLERYYHRVNWHDRDLFDHFDSHEIFIEIIPQYDIDSMELIADRWSYKITYATDIESQELKTDFYNRTLAETAAFEKAFYILEKKLNDVD